MQMAALPGVSDKISQLALDLRGLKCPLPAMKVRKALAGLAPGGRIVVQATDPMSAIDVPHTVASCGGTLISQTSDGDVLIFEIVKS